MHPITFSLQFRGQVTRLGERRRKEARAPGCALVTTLTPDGPAARFEWASDEDEALLESTLTFRDEQCFDEEGTIVFALGNSLRIRGRGRLSPCASPELSHGSVVWRIAGGDGRFDRSSGIITSNFLLSATGDLTENQLAVVFGPRRESARTLGGFVLGMSQKRAGPVRRDDRGASESHKGASMSHRISIRRATVSALVAGSLLAALVPAMAGAATPRAGYYNGNTLQADQTPGTVGFKVFKYGSSSGTVRKVLSVSATTQLTCASGEVKEDRYLVYIIMGGQINKYGKFRYTGNGFSIRGRFTTRTSASGTLSRTVGDCKAENVSWTAKRSTGGLPIPS